jgi:hypothetical protein
LIVLDRHRRDHLAQLAEDDVERLVLDLARWSSPSRRIAAFCITCGCVPTATVNSSAR